MKDAGLTETGLLALYDRVAEAEDAIPRLRRFVLDLAVRGKLVPQDAGDEPASVLLARIEKEKARLVKVGEIRKAKQTTSAEGRLVPFELPQGWEPVFLGGVIDLLSGQHLQPNEYSTTEGAGVPYITGPSDFGETGLSITRFALVRKAVAKRGQLLLTVKGSGVGKTTICELEEVAISRQLMALTPVLWSISFLEIITDRLAEVLQGQARSLIPGIAREDVEQFAFGFPPLAEQHRIVAKVDALMALLDRLEAARAAREETRTRLTAATLSRLTEAEADTPTAARFALQTLPALTTREDQIKTLRQTILNLAVRGKLVEQDAGDEPASVLLEKITIDKASRAVSARDRKATAITPLSPVAGGYLLPPSWAWASFGDVTLSRDGERIPVSKEERETRAKVYDYYGASGVIDKIDGFLFEKPLLLIGEDGANLINRSTPIAFIARGKYWVNNHAHVIDGFNEDYLKYLEIFINAIDLKPYVTGTAQPKMNQAKMNSIPVALPPFAEQHRIVAKVEELMSLCDRLETALRDAATTRARLLDATLRDALAGAQQAA